MPFPSLTRRPKGRRHKNSYFCNMEFNKTTEQDSRYDHLEKMSVSEILSHINAEDKTVAIAVEKAMPQIEALVKQIISKLKSVGL